MNDQGTAVSEAPPAGDARPPAPPSPAAHSPRRDLEALARRLEAAEPAPRKFDFRAPNWLQATLIFAIFGAALFVAVNEHYLWAGILAVAGTAFGVSYVLRRMVGDEYDRA
jgi:hypothetical protein